MVFIASIVGTYRSHVRHLPFRSRVARQVFVRADIFRYMSPIDCTQSAWCATHDHRERGKRLLQKIYGGNAGYDADRQYEILYQTVQHEKQLAIENKRQSWWNIFRGVDGVRRSRAVDRGTQFADIR